MPSSGMLRRVALVSTDVSEELSASFTRVTRIGELGITLGVTSNRRTLVTANIVPSSPILVTLMIEYVPPKCRFLHEPHGVTTHKTPFFIVTDVKT
jgi:hypothetical protein